jgi:hypothetical protein
VTYLTSVAYIRKSKAALLVALFVLGSSLVSWPQIAQANEQVSTPPSLGPVHRATAQLEQTQLAAVSGSRTLSHKGPIVIKEFKHDIGQRLREIAPLLPEFSAPSGHEIENNVNPNHNWSNQVQQDPVLQSAANSPRLQTPELRPGIRRHRLRPKLFL